VIGPWVAASWLSLMADTVGSVSVSESFSNSLCFSLTTGHVLIRGRGIPFPFYVLAAQYMFRVHWC
jgi:hypothetical protein